MHIKLLWNNRNTGVSSVKVYRSLSPMNINSLPEPIATVGPNVDEYIDYDVVKGFTYYYRLMVFRGNEGVISNEFTILAEPASGPGPQTFGTNNGDIEEGYFGNLGWGTMFQTAELREALNIINGTTHVANPTWFKFAYRGKILFIPEKAIMYGTSWDYLYKLGLVYGVDGPGPGLPTDKKPINQLRIMTKGGHRFKVRLMTGAEADPTNTVYALDSINVAAPVGFRNSEWESLMIRGCSTPIATETKPKFNLLAAYSTLGLNDYTASNALCQETFVKPTGGELAIVRGYYNSISQISTVGKNSTTSQVGWRPVLEYIPW